MAAGRERRFVHGPCWAVPRVAACPGLCKGGEHQLHVRMSSLVLSGKEPQKMHEPLLPVPRCARRAGGAGSPSASEASEGLVVVGGGEEQEESLFERAQRAVESAMREVEQVGG